MAKFELREGESLVREEKAGWLKSKIQLHSGKLILTDQRLVFCMLPRWAYGFGVIGMLLSSPTRVAVDLERSAISGAEQGKHGKNKDVLSIVSGDAEYRFVAQSYAELICELSPANATA